MDNLEKNLCIKCNGAGNTWYAGKVITCPICQGSGVTDWLTESVMSTPGGTTYSWLAIIDPWPG